MSARAARPAHGVGGFTLIELMVALVVASMVVGFIFRIYATCSVAYRTQSQLSETMQSMRTAKQLIEKDLRQAGYFAAALDTSVNTGIVGQHKTGGTTPAGVYMYSPITIINSSTGPDELHIVYADTTCSAHVQKGPAFNSAESDVDNTSCFADGDVVVAVRTADGAKSKAGWGCVLMLTGVQTAAGHLQHNPGQGAPYNQPGNSQCDLIGDDWSDGNTEFMKFSARGYRIKPNDARGVLQTSPTAGAANDWQDLAFGFVDMQFAANVYEPADTTDDDGLTRPDGTLSAVYDWYSGANLTTLDLTNKQILQVRVSLIARTIAEVEGAGTALTPSLLGSAAKPNNNPVGDHDSVTISTVTNTSSPYYGNYLYRMVSTVVDTRNLGIGTAL